MLKNLLQIVIAVVAAQQCSAKLGGLLAESVSSLDASQLKCFNSTSNNFDFLVVPISAVFDDVKSLEDEAMLLNATRNLTNFRTDILFQPNPQLDARKQVEQWLAVMLAANVSCHVDTVWIAVMDARISEFFGSKWFGKNRKMNREFIDDIAWYLHTLSGLSKNASCNPFKVGIYTDFDNWQLITKNCTWIYNRWFATKPYEMPLWFIGDNDFENMNDYDQIGGWHAANRKQFGPSFKEFCGIKVQLNYQEE